MTSKRKLDPSEIKSHIGYWMSVVSNHVSHDGLLPTSACQRGYGAILAFVSNPMPPIDPETLCAIGTTRRTTTQE
jgi:hypothetical protein